MTLTLTTTTRRRLRTGLMGAALVGLAGSAAAGTTGTEFQTLHTMLANWANGYLGKSIAVAAFLLGAGAGLVKSTLMPALVGIGFAALFAVGPGILDNIMTATI